MARNRTDKKVVIAAQNTWQQVAVALTGKKFTVKTERLTPATATVEVALSVSQPGGAGTALEVGVATECSIENAATHTLWVRRTSAGVVNVEVDPQINGNVLSATA